MTLAMISLGGDPTALEAPPVKTAHQIVLRNEIDFLSAVTVRGVERDTLHSGGSIHGKPGMRAPKMTRSSGAELQVRMS
jgi:hypothetical protein